MSVRPAAALYTSEILALAVELAGYPMTEGIGYNGEAASRVCGSKIAVALSVNLDGSIGEIGARVSACAVGQAAAALFLRSARGRKAGDLVDVLKTLEDWLGGGETAPDWPDIAKLAPVRAHPARHAAILLPWKAALAALPKPPGAD